MQVGRQLPESATSADFTTADDRLRLSQAKTRATAE
jgi:hypothetical protein